MGQVIQVNGDYNIKAKSGGVITLDTGNNVGRVVVTGDLEVQGNTLTVAAEDLQVNDNIIVLNYGETGTSYSPGGGVTLRYSGLQIDRGYTRSSSVEDAFLLFDEQDDTWNFVTKDATSYHWEESNIRVRRIRTDPDTDSGNLQIIGTGTGVIHVDGTTAYENQVIAFGDDAIPNKKYVDDAIQNSPSRQIKEGDTRVIIADFDEVGVGGGLDYQDNPVSETEIAIIVDNVPNSSFYSNRAVIQGLEFNGTEIINDDTNSNIVLRTNGTGKVETNYSIMVQQLGVTPAAVPGYSQLFAKAPSTGDTGLFFSATRSGELVSKNRALLFSMLF